MDRRDSGTAGRAETKAAKAAERQDQAATVWAEVEAAKQAVDEKTERLRAARKVREAQQRG